MLREVHLLESLHHENVIRYHHAWVERCSLTSFGPPVPTLFILMEYGSGGSLQGYINSRKGQLDTLNLAELSNAERIRRFRLQKQGAVHLLSLPEIISLFEDVLK